MKTIITGATGFIGSHCARLFRDAGVVVTALLRPESDADKLPEGVEGLRVDYGSVEKLQDAVRGYDSVVHCAGVVRALSLDAYWRANVEVTENLTRACSRERVDRFIHISSLAAGGCSSRGKPRDENDEDRPLTNYGLSKFAGEFPVRRNARSFTILRPCAVYGPGERDILQVFRLVAERGLDIRPKGKSPLLSFIDGRDVAAAALLCIGRDSTVGNTYYLSDGNFYEWDDFLACVEEAVSKKAKRINIPLFAAETYAMLACGFGKLIGRVPLLNSEKIFELQQEAWTCSPQRFFSDAGFKPRADLMMNVLETAEWYRDKGWIRAK